MKKWNTNAFLGCLFNFLRCIPSGIGDRKVLAFFEAYNSVLFSKMFILRYILASGV